MFSRRNRSDATSRHEPKRLCSGTGMLYVWNDGVYVPAVEDRAMGDFTISIIEKRPEQFPYCLVLSDVEEGDVLTQPIGAGFSIAHCYRENSLHWLSHMDGEIHRMGFKFAREGTGASADAAIRVFVEMFNRCTYASMTGTELDSATMDDSAFEYVGAAASTTAQYEDSTEPMYELDLNRECVRRTGEGNVCFNESENFNRIVVVREQGDRVQLQAHAYDDVGFERAAPGAIVLNDVPTCDGALIDDTERRMLMLSIDGNKLREVDLEHGMVVQEFKPSNDVNAISYSAHVARPDPVYTCLSDKVAFNIDLRMNPRNNVILEDGKSLSDYALGSLKKPLACHATSAEGHLVIGDSVGDIRLYTGPPGSRRKDGTHNPKTAKTLLSTKFPIVAVDVTANGEYVVAVCEKFLFFMKTTYGDGRGGNGFTTRMGKDKPTPLMLQPTPAQLTAMGGIDKLRFTSGGFDRYKNGEDPCITACSGRYLFTWSLEAAKRAAESGHTCLGMSAVLPNELIGAAAKVSKKVVYQTDSAICMAPLVKGNHTVRGERHYWR